MSHPGPESTRPGTFSLSGSSEPPRRDDERRGDGDRDERDSRHPRLSRPAVTSRERRAASAKWRVVLADREARVVLVDERLPVEPERLGVRAQETTHVRGRREDVEALVLEGTEVLRADLRALLELREVEVLTEARLAQAGADVEHERRHVTVAARLQSGCRLRFPDSARATRSTARRARSPR